MNSELDSEYRLRLAKGFHKEAEEDLQLRRWRSCVDASRLSVRNASKAIIANFQPLGKMHNPATELRQLIYKVLIEEPLIEDLKATLSLFDELGFEEHFLTENGDEETYRDPWTLFGDDDATKAVHIMHKCLAVAERFYQYHFPQSPSVNEAASS